MTATRHHTHPSALCACETCDSEHLCELETRIEFAVNPHTGTVIAMWPTDDGWRIEFVHHHPGGRPASLHHDYPTWPQAAHAFWLNAEHQPPAAR